MHYNDQGADFKYLIVNERDKRFGLSVTTVGFQAIKAGSVYPPRNHPEAYYFTAQKGRVFCMNISWYISLKDEELSPPTQLPLPTYPKDRYFSCFPDNGIPTRRCKRQDGTNITSVSRDRS